MSTYSFYPRRMWGAGHNVDEGNLTDVQNELYETSRPFLLPPGAQPMNLYPVETLMLSGRVRGDGMMTHEWTWGFMPMPTFQYIMSTYFPNSEKSVPMTIKERMHEHEDDYERWNVYMIRPEAGRDYRVEGGRVVDLHIRFTVIHSLGFLALIAVRLESTTVIYPPAVSTGGLTATKFTNSQTFGTPAVSMAIFPSRYVNGQNFGTPTMLSTYNLSPTRYIDADSFGTPTVGRGSVDLAPTLHSNSQSFGTPTVLSIYGLSPTLFANGNSFGTPEVAQP